MTVFIYTMKMNKRSLSYFLFIIGTGNFSFYTWSKQVLVALCVCLLLSYLTFYPYKEIEYK